jgi:hypothetical protein
MSNFRVVPPAVDGLVCAIRLSRAALRAMMAARNEPGQA